MINVTNVQNARILMYVQTAVGFRSTKTYLGTFSCTSVPEESVTAVFATLPVSPHVPLGHQAIPCPRQNYQYALPICTPAVLTLIEIHSR